MSKADQAAEAVLDGILDAPIKVKLYIILLIIGCTIFPKWGEWAER